MVSQMVPHCTPYTRLSHGSVVGSSTAVHCGGSSFDLMSGLQDRRFSASAQAPLVNCTTRWFLSYGRWLAPSSVNENARSTSWPCRSMPPSHLLLMLLSTLPKLRVSGSDQGVYGRKVNPMAGQ